MAQAWESDEIKRQGNLYAQAKAKGDTQAMANARAEAERLRSQQGYSTNSSGLNQSALQGYQADSTNTRFTPIQPQQPVDPMKQFMEYQNQLKAQQTQQVLGQLQNNYNQTLASLNTEKSAIQPQYYDAKQQVSANNQLQAKNFAEYLAQRGTTNNGSSAQAELNRNSQLQNNISDLNSEELQAYNDIAKRTTQAQQSYASDVNSAQAGIEATAMQNLMNEWQRQQAQNAENERFNKQFDYQKQQDAINRQDSVNQAMGYVNPTANVVVPENIRQQLAKYADDYSAYANANPNTEMGRYARVLANEKLFSSPELLAKYGGQYKTAEQKAQEWNQNFQTKQFDYQQERDKVKDTQWQKEMDLNLRQQSFQEAQAKIENALSARRISMEGASQAISWARLQSENDPMSLDNQIKLKGAGMKAVYNEKTKTYSYVDVPTNSKESTFSIDDWAKVLDDEFMPKYVNGSLVSNGNTNTESRESRILGLNLSNDMTKALYKRYNIPLPR
ncbi:hypothetical protein [Clostridium sp. BNL1100]|uniref:hypothetical protein n=1 Tax=Clostridium sp. BNL1100 TaxID=755731 RepID=UPI00024A7A89|nr:hypothetical protein [Clostridium sp. BNL1100]AEY66593.1 hypothetical protein Clo1100_2422 [Clostridium sp. BNL1100]